MKKIVDWDSISSNPFEQRDLGNKGKFSSGKEFMAKAYESAEAQKAAQEQVNNLLPALNQLLLIRLKNKAPIHITKSLPYQASELVKSENSAFYQDTQKVIHPGDHLILKSNNTTLQSFLFENSQGEEVEIFWADKDNLLFNTDIYNVVCGLYENK